MKIELTSNTLPIISVGMYNSYLDADEMLGSQISNDIEEGYIHMTEEQIWGFYDHAAYKKHIAECAANFIDGKYTAEGLTVVIKAGDIYSPREYNFATDEIDLTVKFNKRNLLKYIKANKPKFEEFLKETYSSYSGFLSFTANNWGEFITDFNVNREQEIAAALRFWFFNSEVLEDNDKYQADYDLFVDYVNENTYYSEFFDYEDYDKEVETVETLFRNNYLSYEHIDTEAIENSLEILDGLAILKIKEKVIAEIESHTLSLELI